MATAKQLDDITECPICTEVYTDPRVLPCVHTYCLKCIEAWSKDKQPGDEVACPLCRKEFTLSSNGVGDLPKNFLVANSLQINELSTAESKTSPCEACSGDEESESEVQNVASVYCVECQMKICHICERAHKAFKSTRSHKLVEIRHDIKDALNQSMLSSSDQHEEENLKIYCFDCKMVISMTCYRELHNDHKCSDVNKVKDDFRKRIIRDIDNVAVGVEKCRDMLESLAKEMNDYDEQIARKGIEISEKAEQLKQMIDVHKEKLMNELSSMKQKRTKEIESVREEIERQLLSLERYKEHVNEVRQKVTACDVARAASSLHDRADELLMFGVIERTLADLGHVGVTFTSSDYVIDDVNKTLGQLSLNRVKSGEIIYLKNCFS